MYKLILTIFLAILVGKAIAGPAYGPSSEELLAIVQNALKSVYSESSRNAKFLRALESTIQRDIDASATSNAVQPPPATAAQTPTEVAPGSSRPASGHSKCNCSNYSGVKSVPVVAVPTVASDATANTGA